MGLNSDQHYRMPSEEEWHAFGHYYAPKESWNKILDNTGMKTVGVEGHRPDSLSNIVNIKIQPSKAVAPGVYFSINQHYDLATDVSPPVSVETSTFAKILGEDWTDFLGYREKVATTLLSDAKTETK